MCILLLPFCNSYFIVVIFTATLHSEVIDMAQVKDQVRRRTAHPRRPEELRQESTGAKTRKMDAQRHHSRPEEGQPRQRRPKEGVQKPAEPAQIQPVKAEAPVSVRGQEPREEGKKPTLQERRREAERYLKAAREWSRIHFRRWTHLFHGAAAGTLAVGPVSFLLVAGALGAALTLTTLYSTSYAVIIDGQEVGVVADQSMVDHAIQTVEARGTELLGYDYQVQGEIDYSFALTLKSDLSQEQDIRNYFYGQLNEISDQLRSYQVSLDGQVVGVVKDESALNEMLDGIKSAYVTEYTTASGFVEELSVDAVYAVDDLMTVGEMEEALKANTTGETTYTVVKGDTYNGIAYRNDMSLSDLMALNPQASLNRLMVGDVLNVKEVVPALSVQTVEHQVYTEAIECPVETVEDSSMYKGDSKIVTQGEKGEAEVEADVTFINGYEQERTVTSKTTLREPTTTVKAVGTKERPKTASKGTYIWPVSSHRINSYFGGRRIFGSYSYHSGLDIHASYGEAVKAADGGTVTFAGYKGSYGNLVIITHDNGTQTYYAHNSSLVVSAGQKVYQGQTVAKAGSTGRSTGVHCHFEVRVRGTAVNPLNYLR
ncbi:LysM peptidoglycan-binding domain-containing protein [bacterium 1xD42-67]|nr:LysM peptidoglycan-binding domain-containing protein [bacterium 1xD42-67]